MQKLKKIISIIIIVALVSIIPVTGSGIKVDAAGGTLDTSATIYPVWTAPVKPSRFVRIEAQVDNVGSDPASGVNLVINLADQNLDPAYLRFIIPADGGVQGGNWSTTPLTRGGLPLFDASGQLTPAGLEVVSVTPGSGIVFDLSKTDTPLLMPNSGFRLQVEAKTKTQFKPKPPFSSVDGASVFSDITQIEIEVGTLQDGAVIESNVTKIPLDFTDSTEVSTTRLTIVESTPSDSKLSAGEAFKVTAEVSNSPAAAGPVEDLKVLINIADENIDMSTIRFTNIDGGSGGGDWTLTPYTVGGQPLFDASGQLTAAGLQAVTIDTVNRKISFDISKTDRPYLFVNHGTRVEFTASTVNPLVNKAPFSNIEGTGTLSSISNLEITAGSTIVGFESSVTINEKNASIPLLKQPPVLTAPAFTEIAVGGSFDPLAGVSALDSEDGNITSSVVITKNTVNTSTPGVYVVEYSVTDKDGNVSIARQTVVVNDGSFVVGDTTIIQATDFTKRVSEVNTSDPAVKIAAGVKVFSKATGANITSTTFITTDNGGYTNVVGSYPVTLTVESDPKATIDITATVISGNIPVITAPTTTEVAVGGSFDPMAGVSALDTEDGNITSLVVTNNPVNTSVAGVYTVTYEVTDADGNKAVATQIVVVNDGTFVVGDTTIIQATDFTKRVSEVDTSDGAVKTAAGVKVFDKTTGADITATTPVTVNNGGYTNVVGTYPVTFTVDSDPKATTDITATVISGDAPVITAPTTTEVAVGGSFDPMAGVSALDTEDGDLTGSVTVTNNPVNTSVAGVYTVTYEVTDADGNKALASQIVVVNDGTFVVGDTTIIQATDFTKRVSEVDTSDAAVKTAAGVKVFDKVTGADITATTAITVNIGGYTNAVGAYPVTFTVDSDPKATTDITATVIKGDVPIISAPATSEVVSGGSFDPMAGVSALDTEDGDITSSIVVIENTVNTSVPGTYTVTYEVTDADGNKTTFTRTVVVTEASEPTTPTTPTTPSTSTPSTSTEEAEQVSTDDEPILPNTGA